MTAYRTSLPYLSAEDASPDADVRLAGVATTMGFVPTMYQAMANSPGLLATYLDGYERFRAGSGFTPAEQEVVFLAISRYNECTYCVAAHSFIGDHMSKTPKAVIDAIRDDLPISDERLAALAAFTVAMLRTAGRPAVDDVDTFRAAGFSDTHILELVLAIAVKTISNWTNHLFDTPVDDIFAGRAWTPPTS